MTKRSTRIRIPPTVASSVFCSTIRSRKYYAAPNPNLQFTGPPFGQITYGIAIKKGNTALQQEINAALAKVIASGEMRDILSRWGLWTPVVAGALGQPEDPSVPDTEYKAFVASHAEKCNIGHATRPLLGLLAAAPQGVASSRWKFPSLE